MQIVTSDMINASTCLFRHFASPLPVGNLSLAHCHNHIEVVYIVSGSVALWLEDRKYVLGPGDLYLVRSSSYHYLEVLTPAPYERYTLHFLPETVQNIALPETAETFKLPKKSVAAELFSRLDYYHDTLSEADFAALLPLLIGELFFNLKISCAGERQQTSSASPVLTKALDYINSNLFSIKEIDEVAQALFISSNYLFYLFRTTLHCSPKRYIVEKRLLAAQQMIRGGGNPTSVYADCGFREYSTFYRSYRSFFGYPPSQEPPV